MVSRSPWSLQSPGWDGVQVGGQEAGESSFQFTFPASPTPTDEPSSQGLRRREVRPGGKARAQWPPHPQDLVTSLQEEEALWELPGLVSDVSSMVWVLSNKPRA